LRHQAPVATGAFFVAVIASEAKQSRARKWSGLLRRFAPRNDGFGDFAADQALFSSYWVAIDVFE
jgi:hypothetical protein